MAQSSNALREPTMDEILTSIREIIEENTAQAAQIVQNDIRKQDVPVNRNMSANTKEGQALSVDDAMRALAARIGLVEPEVTVEKSFSDVTSPIKTQTKEQVQKQAEQPDIHDEELQTRLSSQSQKSSLQSSFFVEAEEVAAEALRPILSEWLQRQLPVLVERILREEIAKSLQSLKQGN